MGNNNEIRLLLGSLRYESAPNTDFSIKTPLVQNHKEIVEYDRIANIDLAQVYDDERQLSTKFRPSAKFNLIFKNSYAGSTNYEPFENNLYYINIDEAASLQCANGAGNVSWSGLPQYNEFDFIRNDYQVVGYTQPPNNHLLFNTQSASTYNWNFFLSYPFSNDDTKQLQSFDLESQQTISWVVGDGIPFVVKQTSTNGQNLISFRCPFKHGLKSGQFVKIKFNTPPLNYNGDDLFQVYSLGGQLFGSEEYIFNIENIGYTGTTFLTNRIGTFKRVVVDSNVKDTISRYYIRKNKIITNVEDSVLVKAGFEQNIFGKKLKYESSGYTPNNIARVSTLEGGQSYTLSFNKDVDLLGIRDNLNRPVTELFFTVMWKGYFGWTSGKIKEGYEFNLQPNIFTNQPNTWWDTTNTLSDTPYSSGSYTNPPYTFNYVNSLYSGYTIDGDLCEFNDYEQQERVMSEKYHKITFNPNVFNLINTNTTNPYGYYYKPLNSLKIRQYSDYLEYAERGKVDGIPDYAYFSTTLDQFIWRDIYTYGFIDGNSLGVNYPFLNGAHYPFKNIIFRIIPEGTNYTEFTQTAVPLIDECE